MPTDDAELTVFLDGTEVGTLTQTRAGALSFTYDHDYRADPDATPLSLSLPLIRDSHKNKPTRAFLQGLLPDSPGRSAELAREFRVSADNPFALLAHIGHDAAGAVQILPPGVASTDAATAQGDVRILTDSDFTETIDDVIANSDTWGRRTADARWSLPGAQPKIALFRTPDGDWAIPRDATPTTHILKPAVPPFADHHINEFMTMTAAEALGLRVARSEILTTATGAAVFVSERYDRRYRDGRWQRLHQEDLCQALAVPPSMKYQADGGPTIRQIARLIATIPDSRDRTDSARRFFDALAFTVAIVGTDAHAKNYSLLLDGPRVTLAPLYDLGSHAPYPTAGGRPFTLAMAFDGEYRVDAIGLDALTRAARSLGLDPDEARERAHEILVSAPGAVAHAADTARTQLGDHPFIAKMTDSISRYARERGWA